MRPVRSTLPVLLLALAACGPVTTAGSKTAKATARPVASSTPGAQASAKASPAASATPAPQAALLARPTGDVKVIAGVVRIDASYAVGTGGAKLLSNNGSSAVAASGPLISNNTGNLISEHGGSLISDSGGSLISDGGGSLISNNGGAYHLAQAAMPKQGEVLPAAGLVLAVRNLGTGELLSLGATPQGKPVYEVLTNAGGGFELYVPNTKDSLLLETRFPAKSGKAADPRLQYDLLSDQPTNQLVIDEDSAQVSRYARTAWQSTIVKFVLTDNVDGTVRELSDSDNPFTLQVDAFVKEFHAEAVRVGLDKAPKATVDALATRIADALLARVPLSDIKLQKAFWAAWTGPEEPAIPALVDVVRRLREATTTKLAADPKFFDAQPFLADVNAQRSAGVPAYEIRKAADLNELLLEEYLAKNKHHKDTEAIFDLVGVDIGQCTRMYAAVNNYIAAVTLVLLSDEAAKAKAYELIRSYKP